MKKLFRVLLLLTFSSAFLMTSCGDDGGGDVDVNPLNEGIQGTWSGTVDPNNAFISSFSITFDASDIASTTGNVSITINGTTVNGTYTITNSSTTNGSIQTTVTFENGTVLLVSVNVSGNNLTFTSDINDNKEIPTTYDFTLTRQ